MNNIKPFTFTSGSEPKAVYWKNDIIAYYKEQKMNEELIDQSLNEMWLKNSSVVVLDNNMVVNNDELVSSSLNDSKILVEESINTIEETLNILNQLKELAKDVFTD
jgi:hypothetical protein